MAESLAAQAKQIEAFTGVDRINVDLHAKVQALQADAERYLWIVGSASISDAVDSEKQRTLIDNAWEKITECTDCATTFSKNELDAAIDAARKGNV